MRVAAVPSAQWPQSAPVTSDPSVSRVHRAKLQITGSKKICRAARSGLCDLPWGRARPAGPSGDVCPQRLFQAPPSRTGLGREQSWRRTTTSMSTCCGCSGRCNALPSLAVLYQKPESLLLAALPAQVPPSPGRMWPQKLPQTSRFLQTWQCWTPGTSQCSRACPTEPWLSLRASLLFWRRVLFHCCLPSSQGSKF